MTRSARLAAAALVVLLAGLGAAEITGLATPPGGTSGQVQYNNRGSFGGVPLSSATLAALPVSTGTLRVDLTAETARATTRENAVAASTGTTYTALNSTAAALTVEVARATAAEAVLSASTASLASVKLSSPTVAGAVGNALTIGSNGLPAWASVSGGGGSSSLAVFNGVSAAPGVALSSPTSGINFNSANFTGALQGSGTTYLTLKTVTCTLPNVMTALNAGAAPTCSQPSNVTGTAAALASAGSAASSGFVCRGEDASGNCLPASVDATTNGVGSSTSPWSSGAASTSLALKAPLTGVGASGTWPISITGTAAELNTYGTNGSSGTYLQPVVMKSTGGVALSVAGGGGLAVTYGATLSSVTYPGFSGSSTGTSMTNQYFMPYSSVTVNGIVLTTAGSTITVGQYPMTDFDIPIVSSVNVSTNQISFGIDFTSGTYTFEIEAWGVITTTTQIRWIYNGDATSTNYTNWTNDGLHGSWAGAFYNYCYLADDDQFTGVFNLSSSAQGPHSFVMTLKVGAPYNVVNMAGKGYVYNNNNGVPAVFDSGCSYKGSAKITNIKFFISRPTSQAAFKIRILRRN